MLAGNNGRANKIPSDTLIGNHGPGPQNVVAGCGPQYNMNGTGTQNNYYGPFQDPRAIETKRLQEEEEEFRKEKEDCLRSLSFLNMNARQNTIDDAHPNTCDWLFSTTEFEKWRYRADLSSNNGVFWIKGKPGAGKSTLMNHTLSYCEEVLGDHLIAAYFFNARGGVLEKTPLGMMRMIVYQLINKDDTLCRVFLAIYREKRRIYNEMELHWQQSELEKFIQSIPRMPQLQSKPLLLLVDALDECAEKEVRDVVGFLETLSVNSVKFGVELRICLSSRHYPRVSMKKNIELTVERRHEHGTDIAVYVREKLHTDDDSIERQIPEKAGGIFMWVVLVVAILNKAHDEGREEAMQTTLDNLPEDLEGMFTAILGRSDSDKAELISMLQWVLFSQRPLTPEELYIATVSESLPSHQGIRRRIVNSSKGLIEFRKEETGTETVQFIHLSVNDFLHRNKRLETLDPTLEPDAISASHAYLWAYCWSYIKHLDATSINEGFELHGSHPFLWYAASYILDHADQALSNDTIACRWNSDISQWLAARDGWLEWVLESVSYVRNRRKRYALDHLGNISYAGLVYILTHAPFQHLIKFAVQNGADINAQGGYYGNALQVASYRNFYVVVKLLIEKGADVNAQGGRFGNALQAACLCPSYEIVQLLIEEGADVNAQGGEYGNALQAASYCGCYEIVKFLIAKGADVNAQGGQYHNALQAASLHHPQGYGIAKLLIEKGADVNAQGGVYYSALQAASGQANYEVVQLLIEKGADVNLQGGHSGNALQAASSRYSQGYFGRASYWTSYEIVQLLLEKGANVNAQGGYYHNALRAAYYRDNSNIAELLIENGAKE